MDATLFLMAYTAAFAFGYVLGKWNGYHDALPKRDERGRFKKED